MAIEINGKVYRNIQEQVAENQDNITDLQDHISAIQALIDSGEIGITIQIVETLPTEDINPHCIYLILNSDPELENVYDEYMYIENNWELIGSTATDLTDYYTKSETDTAIENRADWVEVFYNTTTYDEITTIVNTQKKMPYCKANDRYYLYSYTYNNRHYFSTIDAPNVRMTYCYVTNTNSWANANINIQSTAQKVSSIIPSTGNTNYPSVEAAKGLMTPSVSAYNIVSNIGEAQFTFTDNVFNASNNKWLGTFTMGNCFFMIPLYGLTQGTTYKTNGTFVYSSLGEVVSTTINYKITNNTTITVWSGNSNFDLQSGYTAYLSLLRLF